MIISQAGGCLEKKNKALVVNMQHVETNLIPPRSGPNPQGLNVPTEQVKTIKNSEKINGRRQHR